MSRRPAVVEDSSDTEELSDNQEIYQQPNVPVSRRSLEYPAEEGDVVRRIKFPGKPSNTLAMIREALEFHGKCFDAVFPRIVFGERVSPSCHFRI